MFRKKAKAETSNGEPDENEDENEGEGGYPDPWEALKELMRKVLRDEEPVKKDPFVTKALIGIMFTILTYTISQIDEFAMAYGLIPALLGIEWWRILTNFWLHADWEHYIGNMLFLFVFGDNVEDRFGYMKYAMFYIGGGIVSGIGWAIYAASAGMGDVPAIGASGAISAVLGAYVIIFPKAKLVFLGKPIKADVFVAIWFLEQFALSVQPTNVAWMSHVAGFVFGMIMGYVAKWTTAED